MNDHKAIVRYTDLSVSEVKVEHGAIVEERPLNLELGADLIVRALLKPETLSHHEKFAALALASAFVKAVENLSGPNPTEE